MMDVEEIMATAKTLIITGKLSESKEFIATYKSELGNYYEELIDFVLNDACVVMD